MKTERLFSRRDTVKQLGLMGAGLAAANVGLLHAAEPIACGMDKSLRSSSRRRDIADYVFKTRLIDTHEHLGPESGRLAGPKPPLLPCDDWALLFSHYFNSDLIVAGMPRSEVDQFFSAKLDPVAKWKLLEPWWPAVKNTGYSQPARIAIRELYGVDELSAKTVARVQEGYERTRRAGFYRRILCDLAGIESCQVNHIGPEPFKLSDMPDLLFQDLSIVGMFAGPNFNQYAPPTGIEVKSLADWHRVINWWFEKYGSLAVAVKTQHAYSRDIDYDRVPAEKAEPIFDKALRKEKLTQEERKLLEDHLFWQAVDQATAHGLPVKIHTGFYAGQNSMPLARLRKNTGSAADLCRLSPQTRFVFMHICYPYYEEMLALTKQWSNAYIDMCWSWIINPLAAKDYFKKHIVTAPVNKLLPFGGDYLPVEPVLGHAIMARRGMAQALAELVEEGWLSLSDAIELVNPVLNVNARKLFQLEAKARASAAQK